MAGEAGESTLSPSSWMDAAQQQQPQVPLRGMDPSTADKSNAVVQTAKNPFPSAEQPQTTTPSLPEKNFEPQQPLHTFLRPKRGGFLGVIDKIADALTGTSRPEVYTDDEGNEYVQHATLTRGQQWARIGSDMFRGAGAGLAAGRGVGHHGNAMLAGAQVAEQRHAEDLGDEMRVRNQVKQDNMDRANLTMKRMEIVEQGLRAARLPIEWNQQDQEFADKRIATLTSPAMGGRFIGSASDLAGLANLMKTTPDLAKSFIRDGLVEPVYSVDPEGHKHVAFIAMQNGDWRKEMLPSGATFHVTNPATGEKEERHYAGPVTRGQQFDDEGAAETEKLKWRTTHQELKNKQLEGESKQQDINQKKVMNPLEEQNKRLENKKVKAETEKLINENLLEGGVLPNGQENPLVDMIGSGHLALDRMSYLLNKNPQLFYAVHQKYPDFDSSKVKGYIDAYHAFHSGHEATAIGRGATAMHHLAELRTLNTLKSRIPGTDDYNRYRSKLNTLVDELGAFYGAQTIPGLEGFRGSLDSVLNRDSSIEEQARSFMDRYGSYRKEWRAAAPSKDYVTELPGFSLEAKQAAVALLPEAQDYFTVKMLAPGNPYPVDVPYDQVEIQKKRGATIDPNELEKNQ